MAASGICRCDSGHDRNRSNYVCVSLVAEICILRCDFQKGFGFPKSIPGVGAVTDLGS